MNKLFRFLGVIFPILVTLITVTFAEHAFGEHVSAREVLALLIATGCVGILAGALLRWWWGVVLVPGEIIIVIALVYILDALDGGINEGSGGDPIPLGAVVVFIVGPFWIVAMLGVALGTSVGKRLEARAQ